MLENSVSLVHVVHEPTVVSSEPPPLLVLLHGFGSNEQDLAGLVPYLDPRFLIVSLRAPFTVQHGGYAWYSLDWTSNGITHDEKSARSGLAAAKKAIQEAAIAYGADPKKIYLAGFSQGAILSLGIALTEPRLISGAVIMSGQLLPTFTKEQVSEQKLSGVPLIVVHGTFDPVLPIDKGREINRHLEQLPVELTYNEYPMAHTISQESLSDISKWLTQHLDSTLADLAEHNSA